MVHQSLHVFAFLILFIHYSHGSLGVKKCTDSRLDCDPLSEYCDHFESLCKPCSEPCGESSKRCWEECPSFVGRVVKENMSNAEQIKNLQIILAVLFSISMITLLMVLLLLVLRLKDRRKVFNNTSEEKGDKDSQMQQIMHLRKIPPSTLPTLQHGTSMQTVTTRVSDFGSSYPTRHRMNGGRMPSEDTVNERVPSPDMHTLNSAKGSPSPSNQGPFTISNSQII